MTTVDEPGIDLVLRRMGWHKLADSLADERAAQPSTPTTSGLHPFACPNCGREREISDRALRAIRAGERDGVCKRGEGCRARLSENEKLRRWWLEWAGVPRADIDRAGGAIAYVARHGLPYPLGSMLDAG